MDDAAQPRKDYPFEFTGNAGEYFRIWIVNILLTIVTLGIYSAWAKVRTNQYFYGNTLVDGSAFEYTADPVQILKGRLLAVAILIAYHVSGFMSATGGLIGAAILMLSLPALIVMALRFRMRYTSWRNIKFGFQPDFKSAYLLFGVPLLVLLTLSGIAFFLVFKTLAVPGATPEDPNTAAFFWLFAVPLLFALAFPVWQKMYYQFVANRVQFGSAAFGFVATITQFYFIYIIAAVILVGGAALIAGLATAFAAIGLAAVEAVVGIFVVTLPMVVAGAYFQTRLTNIIYSNLKLGAVDFSCRLKVGRMVYLYLTNSIAIVLSLGLMIPWARVRMAKYRAETMTLRADDLAGFQAAAAVDVSAAGEEIAGMLDIEIGI